jgi:flagellar FliL protein
MAATAAKLDTGAEEGGATAAPKGSGKKKLIIGIVVAALLGMGAGGYYYYQRSKNGEAEKAALKKKSVFFDLPEITVNLANTPGQERPIFLRLKLALEVEDQKVLADIQPLMPRVIDNFQIFLREMRPGDLEGSPGLYRLKEELVRRINAAVYPARIEAIIFKDILVQ